MTDISQSGPRVLVVEDHPDTADFLSRYARLLGCVVKVAGTGKQALEKGLEFLPQIVLLDIGLPDIDGWEVARQLRKKLSGAPPILIAITAFRSQDDRIRSHEAGIDYHLNKPAFREELMRLLMQLVAQK